MITRNIFLFCFKREHECEYTNHECLVERQHFCSKWMDNTHTHTQNETCIHFGIMKCMKQITIYRNKKKIWLQLVCVCARRTEFWINLITMWIKIIGKSNQSEWMNIKCNKYQVIRNSVCVCVCVAYKESNQIQNNNKKSWADF